MLLMFNCAVEAIEPFAFKVPPKVAAPVPTVNVFVPDTEVFLAIVKLVPSSVKPDATKFVPSDFVITFAPAPLVMPVGGAVQDPSPRRYMVVGETGAALGHVKLYDVIEAGTSKVNAPLVEPFRTKVPPVPPLVPLVKLVVAESAPVTAAPAALAASRVVPPVCKFSVVVGFK
ncbi:MAG: hypothetical protein JNL32_16915, partial [Candidatus Kapabacteria bacterium]|nr:hypothetical protein [Candidatus Kapabacteria bacterium]